MDLPIIHYFRFNKADSGQTQHREQSGAVQVLSVFCLTVLFSVPCFCEDFGISRRKTTGFSPAFSVKNNSLPPSSQPLLPVLTPSFSEAPLSPKTASQLPSPEQNTEHPKPVITPANSENIFSDQLPNVVRVVAFDSNGQSLGSGSYIGNYGEYGLILSNWHVIDKTEGLAHIHFPNGFSSYGAVIQADTLWDLTLVVISRPPQSVPRLLIADAAPKPGNSLRIAGYGAGSYRLAGGRCVRYSAPEIPKNGTAPLYEIVELSVSARQGDSGGPILNEAGELAGVLFGSDMVHNTAGSCCKRVNLFLSQTQAKLVQLPSRPEIYFASIEPAGPRRNLNETMSLIQPENRTAEKMPHTGNVTSSANSFGVRSNPQRYTQPATF